MVDKWASMCKYLVIQFFVIYRSLEIFAMVRSASLSRDLIIVF